MTVRLGVVAAAAMVELEVRDPAYALAVVRDIEELGDTLPATIDVSPRRSSETVVPRAAP